VTSLRRGLATGALLLAAAACGGEYPQSSIDPKSDFAQSIHSLYVLIFWITLAILVIVWGVLGYILAKFRERPDSPRPRQIKGHLGMEILWTMIPAVIVIAIAVPTVRTVFRTQRAPGPDILVVDVIGHQFWWEFRYPDGVVTANDLHLPVGVPVTLRMHSVDVIHSFWVPMLGGKRDVNPQVAEPPLEDAEAAEGPAAGAGETGSFNYLHFTVSEPGVYRGQCAEFCGSSHSLMGIRVVVESPFEFQAWLSEWRGPGADTAATPPVLEGEQAEAAQADSIAATLDSAAVAVPDSAVVATAGAPGGGGAARVELGRRTFHSASCIACHAIQGTNAAGQIGPNLTLFGRRATVAGWLENTPDNLVRWITSPQSVKPGARMPGIAEMGGNFPPTNLSEEQVRAVAEYLYSLGRAPEGSP
jgi:cytochrome c oxidase subunit II